MEENKTYKGYEILKMLDEGKIKDGTELIFRSTIAINQSVIVKVDKYGLTLLNTETNEGLKAGWLVNSTIQFKEKDIDIQNIEELDKAVLDCYTSSMQTKKYIDKINELIQAVKQLDNKINKKG